TPAFDEVEDWLLLDVLLELEEPQAARIAPPRLTVASIVKAFQLLLAPTIIDVPLLLSIPMAPFSMIDLPPFSTTDHVNP
uniref:hypothetical protein n=1 Tax=Ferrimicrobium sp. TaxID=2926050 RepID=UPI0026138C5A